MITWNDLTPMGRIVAAVLATLALLLLMGVAGAIETSDATPATNAECDAMYHAVWMVQDEPSHSTLVDIATSLDCPFSE